MTNGQALAVIPVEQMTGIEIFKGMASILDKIKQDARDEAAGLDISTKKNREALASLAYKVARSKTFIDEQGKKLVEEQKKAVALIDADRKKAREELDALKDEVRKPLTDWENAEKDRVAGHERALNIFSELVALPLGRTSSATIEERLRQVSDAFDRDWEEFSARAKTTRDAAFYSLNGTLEAVKREEAERVEQERLRLEAAERAIKEREGAAAKVAREAAELAARKQAEAVAIAAEQERQRIERERFEAEARAKVAEAARIAAIEQAKRDAEAAERQRIAAELAYQRRAIEAEQKAERDRTAAIEAERQRVAAEQKRERDEQDARERNRAHRAKINREAKAEIVRNLASAPFCVNDAAAEELIRLIAKGLIPHVAISYREGGAA